MAEERAQKRQRLAEINIDPALTPDLSTDNYHPSAQSLIQPPFDASAFNQQYHWPAEPTAPSSSNLGGIVLPPLVNQDIEPAMSMPLGGMRFSDETLQSAVAAGAARAMALNPASASSSAGMVTKLAPQVGTSTRSNGASAAYGEIGAGEGGGEGETSRRASESELHHHLQVHAPDDDGEDHGEGNGHDEDGLPLRQTPFSRTPELKVHHKLAERQRRKEMKDLFDELREQLPTERGSKSSKWEILKRAIEYIDTLRHSQSDYVAEVERLRREVEMLGGAPAAYGIGLGMAGGEQLAANGRAVGVVHNEAEHSGVGQGVGHGHEG